MRSCTEVSGSCCCCCCCCCWASSFFFFWTEGGSAASWSGGSSGSLRRMRSDFCESVSLSASGDSTSRWSDSRAAARPLLRAGVPAGVPSGVAIGVPPTRKLCAAGPAPNDPEVTCDVPMRAGLFKRIESYVITHFLHLIPQFWPLRSGFPRFPQKM